MHDDLLQFEMQNQQLIFKTMRKIKK
jgi:hypothetical protein